MSALDLTVQTVYTLETLIQQTLDRLRAFEPAEGYYLCDSGGKDSGVLHRLTHLAGVRHDAHCNITSVDPPELIRFLRARGDVKFHLPEPYRDMPGTPTMWRLIRYKLFPPVRSVRGRGARWCCEALKESGGRGRTVLTGVRWEESSRRKRTRKMVEDRWQSEQRIVVNPIIDWTDAQVWAFTRQEGIPYCSLYDEGFTRLGCILCPQQGQKGMLRDAARWPKYAAQYIRVFDDVVRLRQAAGKRCTWASGLELFDWWVGTTASEVDSNECFLFQ
jgi:phosphoadenosine phosphosulfate reductase